MAKTTGTVYVKIKSDTSALRAALDEFGNTIEEHKRRIEESRRIRARSQQIRRMCRFDREMRRIQTMYRLAGFFDVPVWEAEREYSANGGDRWVRGLGL